MGNSGILFSLKGRIGPSSFWRGAIILIALGIVLNLAVAYVHPLIIFLGILFIYPYICVYGKRLHDAGYTAWLVILVIGASFLISYVLGLVLQPMFGFDEAAFNDAVTEAGSDLGAVLALSQEAAKAQMIPAILNGVISGLIIAFLLSRLPSNPGTNQYGPPEHGSIGDENHQDDIFS